MDTKIPPTSVDLHRAMEFVERAKTAPTYEKQVYWAKRARSLVDRLQRAEARQSVGVVKS